MIGEPAFPTTTHDCGFIDTIPGMTLRQLYAAFAMMGSIARGGDPSRRDFIAEHSFAMADAMIDVENKAA